MSQQQRVVLVSGANKGIGLEVVKLIATKYPQHTILLGTRDLNNGEQALKSASEAGIKVANIKLLQFDVSKLDSIQAAVTQVDKEYGHLDVLFNNSGIATFDENREVAESVLDVNVRGVQRMHDAFLPLLLKSNDKPLIVITGSETGAWFIHQSTDDKLKQLITTPEQWTNDTANALCDDYIASFDTSASTKYSWSTNPEKGMFKIYCVSKALVGGYARWYAQQHPEIKLAVTTPGYCATDLNGHSGPRKPSKGAESMVWHMDHEFTSGAFYRDGEVLPWSFSPEEYAEY